MRELVIKRIVEYTDGELDEYDISVDELTNLTDEELLDLFQEIIFPG